MASRFLLDISYLLLIGLHCFCRGMFHDYQFMERDSFGSWAQDKYLPSSPHFLEVNTNNKRWHRWLWMMITTLFASMLLLLLALHYGQRLRSVLATMVVGFALYSIFIDGFINHFALHKGLLYMSDLDRARFRFFRIDAARAPVTYLLVKLLVLALAIGIWIWMNKNHLIL